MRDARGQGFARVVGHRDERLAGMVADLVHRRNVGMIQRAGRASLPQQAGRGVRIVDRSGREELQRDPLRPQVRSVGTRLDDARPSGGLGHSVRTCCLCRKDRTSVANIG